MPAVKVQTAFGHAARSIEGARASLAIPRPASLRLLADRFDDDLVFDEPLVTSGGVALGGHQRLVIRRDGSYTFTGHFRATGWPSYDVSVMTTLGYSIPNPAGGDPVGAQVVMAARGRVHGTNESGDREYSWSQEGVSPLLATNWELVRRATFSHNLQYDTDWFGSVGSVVSFLAQVVALGTVFGAAGVAITVIGTAAELLNVEQLVIPGMVGVVIAGAAAFVFGPGVFFPVFLTAAVVTAALIKQRHLEDHERAFADKVFAGKVPYDRVLVTNLVGIGGRPFTAPGPGGAILVNLGEGYHDPVNYTGKGGEELNVRAPGQLLIHELTHAWQIANEQFTPEYYCRALGTSAGTAGGDMSAYRYGAAGGAWGDFNTEQQGSVVDEWFAGNLYAGPQAAYGPMQDDPNAALPNPYFRYIRDNIRAGIS